MEWTYGQWSDHFLLSREEWMRFCLNICGDKCLLMGDNLDLRKRLHLSMFEWDLTPLVSYIVILRDYIDSNIFILSDLIHIILVNWKDTMLKILINKLLYNVSSYYIIYSLLSFISRIVCFSVDTSILFVF